VAQIAPDEDRLGRNVVLVELDFACFWPDCFYCSTIRVLILWTRYIRDFTGREWRFIAILCFYVPDLDFCVALLLSTGVCVHVILWFLIIYNTSTHLPATYPQANMEPASMQQLITVFQTWAKLYSGKLTLHHRCSILLLPQVQLLIKPILEQDHLQHWLLDKLPHLELPDLVCKINTCNNTLDMFMKLLDQPVELQLYLDSLPINLNIPLLMPHSNNNINITSMQDSPAPTAGK